jgi:hypothetical protein
MKIYGFSDRTIHLLVLGGLLTGCAGVDFYSTPNLQRGTETGIPIYASKPYLLVARTGSKDKPTEISVVHLSDPSKVIYAKPKPGFGSSNLTLALSNGQMTAFGQQVDTKTPELITSLAGLITARGGASKAEAEAEKILSGLGTQQGAILAADAGEQAVSIAREMLTKLGDKSLDLLLTEERNAVASAAQALLGAGTELKKATNTPAVNKQHLDSIKAQKEALGKKVPAPSGSTPRDMALQIVVAWVGQLGALFESAQPEKPQQATFELYEIVQDVNGGAATLRRVNLPQVK